MNSWKDLEFRNSVEWHVIEAERLDDYHKDNIFLFLGYVIYSVLLSLNHLTKYGWRVPREVQQEFDNVFKFTQADEKENIIARLQQRHGCSRARAMRLAVEVEQQLRDTRTWR
jgi:hypothetical protein